MIQLLFTALNIIIAWWHARLIKQQRPIKHGWWGLAYIIAAGVASFIAKDWILLVLLLLNRKLVFDISLNLFRGLPPFHVSLTTTSIVDNWQRKIFGRNGFIVAVICAVLILGLNLISIL